MGEPPRPKAGSGLLKGLAGHMAKSGKLDSPARVKVRKRRDAEGERSPKGEGRAKGGERARWRDRDCHVVTRIPQADNRSRRALDKRRSAVTLSTTSCRVNSMRVLTAPSIHFTRKS